MHLYYKYVTVKYSKSARFIGLQYFGNYRSGTHGFIFISSQKAIYFRVNVWYMYGFTYISLINRRLVLDYWTYWLCRFVWTAIAIAKPTDNPTVYM